MAVIINDFEVIAEPPPRPGPSAAETAEPPAPSASSTPRDIERIIEHLEDRLGRVWTH